MDIIKTILKKYTDVPISEDSALIEDLGLDSFLIVYFLSEVEDSFGVDIDASKYTDTITIRDVLDLVHQAGNTI